MDTLSTKPLFEKLGIKSDIYVINPPETYETILGGLPEGIKLINDPLPGEAEFIHFFTTSQDQLINEFPKLKTLLSLTGSLWVSWPKKSSSVPNDLDENIVREIGLINGLVDVKICSINSDWSGLKFVYRIKDRKDLL